MSVCDCFFGGCGGRMASCIFCYINMLGVVNTEDCLVNRLGLDFVRGQSVWLTWKCILLIIIEVGVMWIRCGMILVEYYFLFLICFSNDLIDMILHFWVWRLQIALLDSCIPGPFFWKNKKFIYFSPLNHHLVYPCRRRTI